MAAGSQTSIRPLDATLAGEVALVAERMRLTLVEVLGEERGGGMYDEAWRRRRVLWHALPEDGRRAQVLVAEDGLGRITGHTMLRVEIHHEEQVGLFATTYVEPGARRAGVARALVRAGEAWVRAEGLEQAMTFTDAGNVPLQRLFLSCGYTICHAEGEWVGLARRL